MEVETEIENYYFSEAQFSREREDLDVKWE